MAGIVDSAIDAIITVDEGQKILLFNETVGTLVKNGLFDRELVYDWLWAAGVWSKVGPAALRAREQAGVPEPRLKY